MSSGHKFLTLANLYEIRHLPNFPRFCTCPVFKGSALDNHFEIKGMLNQHVELTKQCWSDKRDAAKPENVTYTAIS